MKYVKSIRKELHIKISFIIVTSEISDMPRTKKRGGPGPAVIEEADEDEEAEEAVLVQRSKYSVISGKVILYFEKPS